MIFQEHHLQRAISAQQVYGDTKVMVIPVPEAEISLECYNNLYKKTFRLPKHYVHNQGICTVLLGIVILKYILKCSE